MSAPVWFIAHGGPMTLHAVGHPALAHWRHIAQDIRSQKPPLKGIVFISAHWQAEQGEVEHKTNGILVNIKENNHLLYDYYGFPESYYQLKMRSNNPPWLSDLVKETLEKEGFSTFDTQRGLDHGVFIPLLAGFGEEGEGLPPLVQISLPVATSDPAEDGIRALRLGKALRSVRSQGIAVIGGGQPVHNLRDFRHARVNGSFAPPYTTPFAESLTAAICPIVPGKNEAGEPKRWEAAKKLFQHRHYAGAHPTSEHLLPALVALGAARDDEEGKEEFKMDEGPLAWNMYKWDGSAAS